MRRHAAADHGMKAPADPVKLIADLGFDSVTSYVWIHHVTLPNQQTDFDFVRDSSMEPDTVHGMAYLDAVRVVFGKR